MQLKKDSDTKSDSRSKTKTKFDIEFTSQQYIHISDEEYTQLLSNVFQHNTGDPLFDQ